MSFYNFLNAKIVKPLALKYRNVNYFQILPELENLHKKSLDEIRDYQFSRFCLIVDHAYQNVPFYRREWNKIGLRPLDIKSFDDIRKIPVLTKQKLRKYHDEFMSDKCNDTDLTISGTGGTTDSPITLKYGKKRLLYKLAEMHYFREWWNWDLGDKIAYLWGAPQDIPNIKSIKYKILNKVIARNLFLFASFIDEEIMMDYIKKINGFKPDILQGYSNPVYLLSEFILKKNIPIYSPKSVILTAEPLSLKQRQSIQNAFKCEVYTFYGCREGGYVGIECREHSGYHMNCSSLYIEILTENMETKSGEIGNVIFTDLYNFHMPFIRYQIGDLAIPDDIPCPCISTLPKMSFFAGRETDVFITPNGKLIPGVSLCDRVIEDCKGIEQLQFIQNKIDELEVKIVKGPQYSNDDINRLDNKLDAYFQGNLKIYKKFVADIPKEKSGKTRFCISNVAKNI